MENPAPPLEVRGRRLDWLDVAVVAGIALISVALRFVTTSPLWLDEALSVNIAELPLGEIADALRRDGHPPLYYYLLHGWMELFGTGDVAVRALSGIFGVAVVPLAFVAGRRIGGSLAGWSAAGVLALSPYAVRYSTETRMYAMVMVLTLAIWLVADDAIRRPGRLRLVGLGVLSAMLLWTHYWGMWFVGGLVAVLAVRTILIRRSGGGPAVGRLVRVIIALGLGAATFTRWLGTLWYQANHTGTPWAGPVRPTEVVARSLVDLGGGAFGEATLVGVVVVIALALALFGRAVDRRHISLDLATRPEARPMAITIAAVMTLALLVGYGTQSAFATRYLAVVVPLVLVLVGLGLTRFSGPVVFRVALAVVWGLSLVGSARNATTDRTQAEVAAEAIAGRAGGADDLVVICPDQLGPALSRELPATVEAVTYPRFEPPDFVDWVDYTERLAEVEPAAFAAEAVKRAGDRPIWLVWSGGYQTHEESCAEVLNGISEARPGAEVILRPDPEVAESEAVYRFPAPDEAPTGG